MKNLYTALVILLSIMQFAYGQSNQTKIVTTSNNLVDTLNPYNADIVIGSDLGTRHDASIMW